MRGPYPSDLTNDQYAILEPHVPGPKPGGRPRKVDIREVINAILYLNRTGCQWRALPHDLPKKNVVYYYYRQWRKDGTWDRLLQVLREQVRQLANKEPTPRMVILDSQSVKGTELGVEHGIDAHKKINGRKRHIAVDTLGLLVAVRVTSAAILDGSAAMAVLEQLTPAKFPRLQKALGDNAYGKCGLPAWVHANASYVLEVTGKPPDATPSKPGQKKFKVIKWRWIVERTFAWLGRYRRHSKDYERLTESSATMIKISSIHRMLRCLKPSNTDRPFCYPKSA
jgi:putative transposase